MDGKELSPDEADANTHLTSTRQKALEGWFQKREWLRKAIAGRAPLTLQRYGSEDAVRAKILAVEAYIFDTLAKLTDDGRMKEFYSSTAGLLAQLRCGPLTSFVREAPALYAKKLVAAGMQRKKKAGAPKVVAEVQRPSLQVLDAIIRLANDGFFPMNAPVQLVADKLGIGRDALTYHRGSLGGDNPWVTRLREEWGGLLPEERAAKARERIEKEAELFRIAGRVRKRRATAKSADFSR